MNQVPEACLIDGCTLVAKYPGFMTVRTLVSQSLQLALGFLKIFPKSKYITQVLYREVLPTKSPFCLYYML